MNMNSHCAEFNGQYCVCESNVWAMQNDKCSYSEKSAHHGKCLYMREYERCDHPDVNAELKNGNETAQKDES